MGIRDIILQKRKSLSKYEIKKTLIKCKTVGVQSTTSCAVTGRPNYMWVTDGADIGIFQAFNTGIQDRVGNWVWVTRDPGRSSRYTIIGIAWEEYAYTFSGDTGDYTLPNHHGSHEIPDGSPGVDVVMVYPRALTVLRTSAYSGLTVAVSPVTYEYNGESKFFHGQIVDLTTYLPTAGNAVRVLLYLDITDGFVYVVSSDEVDDSVEPGYEAAPLNGMPSAWIYLLSTYTSIVESYIQDARIFLKSVLFTEDDVVYSTENLDLLARLESEQDMQISRHVVEG